MRKTNAHPKAMNLKTESFSLKRHDRDVVLLIRQILTEIESEAKQVLGK